MENKVFQSGASSSEEAPRIDYLSEAFLRRTAERMDYGARRHGPFNYRKGAGDADFIRDRINHSIWHLRRYAGGDRSEDHLSAAAAGLNILMDLEEIANGSDTVRS